jgi:uncharacterized protein YjiS (DUF1127 family)
MEVAMNDILMSASHLGARPATRRFSLTALRSRIAAERERARFRLDLKRMARDNPHLIDDIGLTNREVEEEIAKLPFWQR